MSLYTAQVMIARCGLNAAKEAIEALVGNAAAFSARTTSSPNELVVLNTRLAVFDDHGLENDREINFEDFVLQLELESTRPPSGTKDDLTRSMALFLGEALADRLHTETMVVENLQRVLARHGSVLRIIR